MTYRIVFSPQAQEQLAELFRYIAEAASPDIASRYAEAIVIYCESLRTFPLRGTKRDDVRPGLRITNDKKRAVIAFAVDAELVSIIGVFYGGQDFETTLQDESDYSSMRIRGDYTITGQQGRPLLALMDSLPVTAGTEFEPARAGIDLKPPEFD